MPLPNSGQISAANLNSELGRAAGSQVSLGETAVRNLAGIGSGQIAFSDLHGKTAASVVSQYGGTVHGRSTTGSTQGAVTFNTDGTVTGQLAGTIQTNGASGDLWYSPATSGIGASYWIRGTLSSGLTPNINAGLGSWLQLNANRQWGNSLGAGTGPADRSSTILFEIAASSGGTVLASGTFTVSVMRDGNV